MDRLDVGLLRLNDPRTLTVNGTSETADVYQLDGRYQILKQDQLGVDFAVVGGVTWFAAPDKSLFGVYGQLIASRVSFDRLHAGVSLLFHSNSTSPNKVAGDSSYSLGVAAFAELRILTALAWSLEMTEAVAGYRDRYPVWTTGPKVITHRHTFSFVVTNTQFVSADGIVANTSRGGNQLIFGFNLTREL